MSHEEFAQRYGFLVGMKQATDAREVCLRIVQAYPKMDGEIRVGKGQIYATEHGIELIEQWKEYVRSQAAGQIQRWWRTHLQRKRAAHLIQCWWRRVRQIRAAKKVQLWWRRKRSKALLLARLSKLCASVRIIQRAVRRWLLAKRTVSVRPPTPALTLEPSRETAMERAQMPESHLDTSPPLPSARQASEKLAHPLGLLSLQLSRSHFFYSDGVISIRRPTTVRCSSWKNWSISKLLICFFTARSEPVS